MTSKPTAALPETIGAGELGRMLDVSAQFLGNLLRDGHIERAAQHGRYQLETSVRGYVHFLRGARKSAPKAAAAVRLQEARADEVALRVAERQRELIPIEDAEAALDHLLATVRSELGGLSARVTRDIPTRRLIERGLNDALERMAVSFDASSEAARKGGDPSASIADQGTGSVGEGESAVSTDERDAGAARAEPDAIRDPDSKGGRKRRVHAGSGGVRRSNGQNGP